MPPDNPFQESVVRMSESTTRLQSAFRYLKKIYVWLPISLLIIAGASVGAYYLLTGEEPPAPKNLPQVIAGIVDDSELSSQSEKSDSKNDKKNSDKKSDEKKQAKKQQAVKDKEKRKAGQPSAGGGSSEGGDGLPSKPSQPPSSPSPPPPPPSSGGLAKPNSSNTGPRYSATRTITNEQAIDELRRTGHLSRVTIDGSLTLSGSDGRNWVIEDSTIIASGHYGIQTYVSLDDFTGAMAERPIFRYVEIVGRAATGSGNCAAAVYGGDVIYQNADIYGCDDGIKAKSRISVIGSWMHDNDHPDGAHCDSLQIRSGTDILVRGSRFDSYVGYSSDGSSSIGQPCSGGLQTGSVINTISARFENNWFAGGGYTIRGWASRDEGYSISYVFRNNKWMRHGTSVRLGRSDLAPHRYGPTTGSLGDFDSSNVWEDTGQPVRN